MRHTWIRSGLVLALVIGRPLLGDSVRAQQTAPAGPPCDRLTALAIPGVRIVGATSVAAGAFTPPGSSGPAKLPAFCRIEAVAAPSSDSVIRFEVWMPPAASWNGKLLAVGNNGFDGAIDYGAMIEAMPKGYATAGSDAGHVGGDLRFAQGHPEKVVDWAYRAVHEMAVAAKSIVRSYEGRFPSVSYFQGCNTGGHQALSEAQRFPADFDGIIAGMPANDRINEIAAYQHMWQAARPNGVNILDAQTLHVLGQAVMKACDALDGVLDGVIDDPPACRFDPNTLRCRAPAVGGCLTADQVTAVERIYRGLHNQRTGERIFAGWPYGTESAGPAASQGPGWRQIIDLAEPRRSEFWKHFVFRNPDWDWRTLDFDRDIAYANATVGFVSAIEPDLSAFKTRGGKLLMYTGWADPILPGGDVVHYYESVTQTMGGATDTTPFARLFMMPGVGHCSGGPGPDTFDPVAAIERWVESGAAPDRLTASKVTGGIVVRTRPLCPYPQVAKWSGSGSTDTAANFACAVP